MYLIKSTSADPYYNAALEEILLRDRTEDFLLLYINKPSVIIGKHQNTLNEINYRFIKQNNIPVVRRLSGGGTVYHDLGNLNFAYFSNGEEGKLIDFKKFTTPVIEALSLLGIEAKYGGNNDLRINGYKISGNAEHVYRRRTLHHGTLLFDSDLTRLNEAIRVKPGKFKDKSVQSVRATVANISDFLDTRISIHQFLRKIEDYALNSGYHPFPGFSESEKVKIEDLRQSKYLTWDWNYGYSPKYLFTNTLKTDDSIMFDLQMEVVKGVIESCKVLKNQKEFELTQKLSGCKHHETDLKKKLAGETLFKDERIIEELFF